MLNVKWCHSELKFTAATYRHWDDTAGSIFFYCCYFFIHIWKSEQHEFNCFGFDHTFVQLWNSRNFAWAIPLKKLGTSFIESMTSLLHLDKEENVKSESSGTVYTWSTLKTSHNTELTDTVAHKQDWDPLTNHRTVNRCSTEPWENTWRARGVS